MLVLLLACAPASKDSPPSTDWTAPGPWAAGTAAIEVTSGDRTLPTRVWYPTNASASSVALADLVLDPEDSATLADLVAAAPPGCPATTNAAVPDAPVADGSFPVVALSHCHDCLAISNATIAARLATHGFVAIAPDHVGNTLFDALAGEGGDLDEATLELRAADVEAAIDAAVAGPWNADADRIGVLGHSFGAVTAGRVTATDDRISALFAAGAPIDNPILPGADAAAITTPTMLLLLEEDHSVGEAGNILIEQNYDELAGPAWLARMPDGGHWSVSDLCGITEDFMPGCGEDTREAGGGTFTYVPADDGRAAAASLASAFFAATLGGDADAAAWLEAPETAAAVEVETTAP